MDIRLDIMANGDLIIYNLCDDLIIEEPCAITLHNSKNGEVVPSFMPLLLLAGNGKTHLHPSSLVLYSTRPNPDLHNIYVDTLNQCRAKRSGVVAPTKAQVVNLVK